VHHHQLAPTQSSDCFVLPAACCCPPHPPPPTPLHPPPPHTHAHAHTQTATRSWNSSARPSDTRCGVMTWQPHGMAGRVDTGQYHALTGTDASTACCHAHSHMALAAASYATKVLLAALHGSSRPMVHHAAGACARICTCMRTWRAATRCVGAQWAWVAVPPVQAIPFTCWCGRDTSSSCAATQ
jgi:hypothetical protein